ncbi:MAG: YfiR family protein [Gammaproteobacteria bacterium]
MRLRTTLTTAIVTAGLLTGPVSTAVTAENFSELEVQAVLLYNVTKFVTWPGSAFAASDEPLNLCSLGDDPFTKSLRILNGKPVKTHPITLRPLQARPVATDRCHILVVSRSARTKLGDVLDALRNQPVLTIGNFENFAHRGGTLSLVKNGKRVSMVINPQAATNAGLIVNSQLLELATIVNGPENEG